MTDVYKMGECHSHEIHNIYPNLNGQQQFRLNKINKINDYFVAEIKERELMTKRQIANTLFLLIIFISH